MYKLLASYQGFKLGVRIADSFTLRVCPTIAPDVASSGLHALKNVGHIMNLERDVKAFGVNGELYTSL